MHYLGVLLHQRGQADAAMALIEHVLALAPGYVDARNNLGNMEQEGGRFAHACASYVAVLAARPVFAPAGNNLELVRKAKRCSAETAKASPVPGLPMAARR